MAGPEPAVALTTSELAEGAATEIVIDGQNGMLVAGERDDREPAQGEQVARNGRDG